MLKVKWESAITLEEFIDQAEKNQDIWKSMHERARVPAEFAERLEELPARYLLVILEDWCGDAFNSVPVIARLAEKHPRLELRVVRRDEHLDLMDQYLSGTSRAIPVVIVMNENFEELGWWGSRPRPLQKWVTSEESRAMEQSDRYREVRRWYARDRGHTTLEEITALLEKTGGEPRQLEAPIAVA